MKRSMPSAGSSPKAKKPRQKEPEYHLTPSVLDSNGEIIWPAPRSQMENARRIIRECAKSNETTLICPDKDADGLTSGVTLLTTLLLLGQSRDKIHLHLNKKWSNIHADPERKALEAYNPSYIFVLDQGSQAAPPLIEQNHTGLVIDHHFATASDFPKDAHHVSAAHAPPVATTSLLTYELCRPLHPSVEETCAWLCAVGTHGDLGTTLKWSAPFPDMTATFKQHTKKAINEAVALLNAPRRTAQYNVQAAWDALISASSIPSLSDLDSPAPTSQAGPKSLLKAAPLLYARQLISAEVERCTHTPPKFTPDARIAVFRIRSPHQVHPLIATRWANHLASPRLEFVLVANEGYADDAGGEQGGKVHFSCRVARCAKVRAAERGDEDGAFGVDIIARLREEAARIVPDETGYEGATNGGDTGLGEGVEAAQGSKDSEETHARAKPLIERLGANFARGHVQASGGIVGKDEFEELMRVMRVGEKPGKKETDGDGKGKSGKSPKKSALPAQKNTLANYFGKK